VDDEFDDDIREVPSHTPDFRTELAEQLSHLAPEAVADGKIDVEKLRELLDEDSADDGRERFGLTWPGKSRALKAAQAPTTATLVPDREASKDWETTQNVLIEGDNLEVLKILQKYYHGKIKMIYIDPPYNTGNDFIYPDNYKEGLQTYLEWTKQVAEGGRKLSSNPESEGRYHSNWLNMMYPRLKLARNLLSDDGIVFVSINDSELSNLKQTMGEIFGEQNFIEIFIWKSIFRPSNLSRRVRGNAEYIVSFAKDRARVGDFVEREEAPKGHASLTQGNNPVRKLVFPPRSIRTTLPDGVYAPGTRGDIDLLEPAKISGGLIENELVISGRFKWKQDYLDNEISKGVDLIVRSEGFIPGYMKTYGKTLLRPSKILPDDLVSDVLSANAAMSGLFGHKVFDYPKPVSLVHLLARMIGTSAKDMLLDFFSGSGTTAHAVMQLNAEDGGSRRHIQVQLPEPVDPESEAGKAGFGTIADITRERIRRAGEKIKEEFVEQLAVREEPLDVGFRSYKLADTSFVKWRESSNADQNALEARLAGLRGSADDDATPEMLLTELLLKQGYSLTESVSEIEVAGLKVWSVADGAMLAVMDEHVKPSLEQLRAVVEAGPVRLVILEDVLAGDDQLKTNLVQHAKTHGVELWSA
jgi:adenine-specific DNA-methyltransferase